MPLYEYRCTACDRLTEKRQKFSDPELTDCPTCGGRLERTITAPAVQFKGGGWYADGYGSRKPAAAAGSDAGGKSASGSDSGSTTKSAEPSGPAPASTPAPAAKASTASEA